MSSMELVLIILGMFAVTFAIRFVLFARANKTQRPGWLEEALKYVPVSVLTAIIAPMSLTDDSGLNLALTNPWFVGALCALIVGILVKHQLLTICVGVLAFFTTKMLLGG